MSSHLEVTQDEIKKLKEAFDKIDTFRIGRIDSKQFGNFLRMIGKAATEEEVERMVNEISGIDKNLITFGDFVLLVTKHLKVDAEDEIRENFRLFDKDGDGYITITDFRDAMVDIGEELSEENVNQLMNGVQWDSEGRMSYEQFYRLMSD